MKRHPPAPLKVEPISIEAMCQQLPGAFKGSKSFFDALKLQAQGLTTLLYSCAATGHVSQSRPVVSANTDGA